jgi:hypothetical protein
MGRHPTERKTPDLFSTATVEDAPAPPKLPAAEATTESATQRHVLPKNLRHAIEQLSDRELDELLEMAFDEEKRRRRLRWSIGRDVTPSSSRRPLELLKKQSPPTTKRRRVDIAEVPLTRGQVKPFALFLSRLYAFTDSSTVWNFPIQRQEGAGKR